MARQRKGEFDDLDSDWKDGVASMSPDEIDAKIAEIAKAEAENVSAKKADQQLQEAKLTAFAAGEQYREHSKMAKLRIRYLVQTLHDKGKE